MEGGVKEGGGVCMCRVIKDKWQIEKVSYYSPLPSFSSLSSL